MVADSTEPLHRLIEQLFVANVDAVYNVAYRVLWSKADAEDAVQATFVKGFTRIDNLADNSKARPWLLQIAYREAITILRRRRDLPTEPAKMPDTVEQRPGPADRAVASAVAEEISAALKKLNEDERLAVVLRDVEQLSMREVAEVLDIGISAAKMRVHRGRVELRRILSDADVL